MILHPAKFALEIGQTLIAELEESVGKISHDSMPYCRCMTVWGFEGGYEGLCPWCEIPFKKGGA